MERLTEKHIVDNIDCGYKVKKDTCEDGIIQGWNKIDAINKLGQLEDIEEELGIDLITLFKQSPLQLKALATLTKEELEK